MVSFVSYKKTQKLSSYKKTVSKTSSNAQSFLREKRRLKMWIRKQLTDNNGWFTHYSLTIARISKFLVVSTKKLRDKNAYEELREGIQDTIKFRMAVKAKNVNARAFSFKAKGVT